MDDQQYLDLAQIRADLDAAGVGATDRIDLIAFYAERLNKLVGQSPSPEPAATTDALQRRYGWLAKFSMLQAATGTGVLDTVA